MSKYLKALIFALCVWFSGLVSCGKNEAPPPTASPAPAPGTPAKSDRGPAAPVVDDFAAPPPMIEAPQDFAKNRDIRTFLSDTLSASYRIVFFDPKAMQKHLPLRYQILSTCSANGREFQQEWATDLPSVELSALLPIEVLFTPRKINQIWTCQFNFEVKNKIGSVHRFQIPNLLISNPNAVENVLLKPARSDSRDLVASKRFLEDQLVSVRLQFNEASIGETNLVCDQFNQRIPKDLASRPMSEWIFADLSNDIITARQVFPKQTCRVLGTHSSGKLASSYFTLIFPAPKPRVWFERYIIDIQAGHDSPVILGYVHIENPTNHWMPVGTDIKNAKVEISHTFHNGGRGVRSHTKYYDLNIENSQGPETEKNGFSIYQLRPRSEIVLTVTTHIKWDCDDNLQGRFGGLVRWTNGFRVATYYDPRTGSTSWADIESTAGGIDTQSWLQYYWLPQLGHDHNQLPKGDINWSAITNCR